MCGELYPPGGPMKGFHLIKWYLDCVTDAGDVFIGYAALLSYRSLHLTFSSALTCSRSGAAGSKRSFRSSRLPRTEGDGIRWTCPPLHVDGFWRSRCPSADRQLLEDDGRVLRWSCLQPSSDVSVVADSERFAGLGYAEVLELSIPPWELPITELRWGRFISETDALVWIDWKGAHPLTYVIRNGTDVPFGSVTDDGVEAGGYSLALHERTIIRHEPVLSLGLHKIAGASSLIPMRFLGTDECKWRSRGTLVRPNVSPVSGWAIHEIVRFP
jgi:hypothetical protein